MDTLRQLMDPDLWQEAHQLHADIFSGLADPNRILILYRLAGRPYFVSELADAIGLPQPTVSRHLRLLREKNLVTSQRQGTSMIYTLTDVRIIEALDIIRQVLADRLEVKGQIGQSVKTSQEQSS